MKELHHSVFTKDHIIKEKREKNKEIVFQHSKEERNDNSN